MTVTIRPAKARDAQAISSLIVGLAGYFVADPGSLEVAPFMETLSPEATAGRIAAPEFEYFVAEDARGLRGVIAIRDGTHVYHLFVDSTAHRQGIARTLWDHVRTRSKQKIFTVNSSLFAVPVYERLGFEPTQSVQTKNGLMFVPMEYRDDR